MLYPGRRPALLSLGLLAAGLLPAAGRAQENPPAPGPVLQIDAGQVTGHVSPTLYGLMTEEINYSYDGGLYAELIRNRAFRDNPQAPDHWTAVQDGGGTGAIALDPAQPLNAKLPVSLRLDVAQLGANQRVGVANEGYWGIAVRPHTTYRASFYAKAAAGFAGSLLVSLESNDGLTVHARAEVSELGRDWQKYTVSLTTGALTASAANRLVLAPTRPGTVWFDLVSLFPPTYHDRPNGNRTDLMQLLAGMKPAFLRFPGGNYLEGRTVDTRFDWKRTVGDLGGRPGHMGTWSYRSSDGLGLLEFLEWCEDLRMQPVLAVFAGLTLDRQAPATVPGPALQPFVQDALDEIEYVTGGPATRWGAERARDGHPEPFPLTYVEIGNEDNFDRKPGSYDGRFTQFYDAIKARYPRLQLIATAKVTTRAPDLQDDHYYRSAKQFYSDTGHYDAVSRNGPKIFVGEWATREGQPTPNLNAALGDAAWMTGMERNSDLVVMASYAPLFVNVSPGPPGAASPWPGMQWRTDLVGYDAMASYGSPSYYAQQMFSVHHGDEILATRASGIGTQDWQPPKPRGAAAETPAPAVRQVPTLFFDATRQSATGVVTLKVVNTVGTAQAARIELAGAGAVEPRGRTLVLAGADPAATNSLGEPTKIVPVSGEAGGLGADFSYAFPPYSITILELQTHPAGR
jgi:alpha-L-arabinofuranosidase